MQVQCLAAWNCVDWYHGKTNSNLYSSVSKSNFSAHFNVTKQDITLQSCDYVIFYIRNAKNGVKLSIMNLRWMQGFIRSPLHLFYYQIFGNFKLIHHGLHKQRRHPSLLSIYLFFDINNKMTYLLIEYMHLG